MKQRLNIKDFYSHACATSIRSCICCKDKRSQAELLRLQCIDGALLPYSGRGRSFYICTACTGDKRLTAALARTCKSKSIGSTNTTLLEFLKGI